jgi:predicted transposase/invertase (TIGR01784 family)
MNILDYNASMKFARKEGVAIGETRGEIKGVLRTARRMKAKGLDVALIAEITGLSEAEIESLD